MTKLALLMLFHSSVSMCGCWGRAASDDEPSDSDAESVSVPDCREHEFEANAGIRASEFAHVICDWSTNEYRESIAIDVETCDILVVSGPEGQLSQRQYCCDDQELEEVRSVFSAENLLVFDEEGFERTDPNPSGEPRMKLIVTPPNHGAHALYFDSDGQGVSAVENMLEYCRSAFEQYPAQ